MKFIAISAEGSTSTHINLEHIEEFWWSNGRTYIQFHSTGNNLSSYKDAEKELYRKLCDVVANTAFEAEITP